MNTKKILFIVIGILLAGLICWQLLTNKKEITNSENSKLGVERIAVTTTTVTQRTVDQQLNLVGTTEANQETQIASEASGKITSISFNLGDYVTKGAVIAYVDNEYKRLALNDIKLTHTKNKEDYLRYQNLREGDAATDTQLRDAKLAYENSAIQLQQAERELKDTYISTPFNGYITSKDVALGSYVDKATLIASIADLSKLKVVLLVSESNAYQLKKGKSVEVSTSQYPGVTFSGSIENISPKGNEAHSYPIEISISNKKEYPLKVGTYVNINIDMADAKSRLMIPRDAIINSIKEPSVYVVNGEQVKLTKITIGKEYEADIEILDGLKEGDNIVISGQINLMDGSKISITNSQSK